MYAIIEDSGHQLRVEEGQTLHVDLRDSEPGDELTFDRVLLVSGEEGVRIGKPHLDGASVTAEVVGQVKGPKLEVVKIKRRKNARRHIGHRQKYLAVKVTSIES